MSFFKRLFGKKDRPAPEAEPVEEVVAEETGAEEAAPAVLYPASPRHFAIIEAPAPPAAEQPEVAEDEGPAEDAPSVEATVESPVLTASDLTFSAEPEEDPEPEPEEEAFLSEPAVAEEPVVPPPPAQVVEEPVAQEPAGPITVARLGEAEALAALEQALDELGSAHHRPFSRG